MSWPVRVLKSTFSIFSPRAIIKSRQGLYIDITVIMSNYKLIYFNARGRAEVSRLIFAQAGVEYEDKRVAGEEWAKLKPTTPTGSLPLLEVDGKQLTGSGVIARFLAERFGLAGSNDIENAEIAGIIDVLEDFLRCMMNMRRMRQRRPS